MKGIRYRKMGQDKRLCNIGIKIPLKIHTFYSYDIIHKESTVGTLFKS